MKENKGNVKKGILIGCIASAAILLGFLGSYAYFIGVGNNTQKESAKLETGNMALTFSDGSSSFQGSLEFGGSATKTFSIENIGSLEAKAKINWKNLKNTYLKESLTYTLSYSETENGTYTEIVTNKQVPRSESPVTKTLASNLTVPVGKTYYYKLVITLNYLEDIDQTSDLNAMLSTEFSLEESNVLVDLLLSKSNDSSITDYNSGTKTEMYTFTHPEAIQTTGWSEEERTDYRYIGNTPNNYVTFNDEPWRIIGVFTVENESGNKEQRIKIIRDDSLEYMSWDKKSDGTYINEWPTSTLSTMLNGDYINKGSSFDYTWYSGSGTTTTANTTTINGLSSTAQNQISPVKWYLGGNSTYQNLGGPDYYSNERGTKVYTGRSTNVIAKVGLMYPSDYVYTYALGVDNTCFSDGYNCKTSASGTPSAGWLFNSSDQWTITPDSSDARIAFIVFSTGSVSFRFVYNYYGVRPSLYLRSDIEITSGDGSSGNPYILGA